MNNSSTGSFGGFFVTKLKSKQPVFSIHKHIQMTWKIKLQLPKIFKPNNFQKLKKINLNNCRLCNDTHNSISGEVYVLRCFEIWTKPLT